MGRWGFATGVVVLSATIAGCTNSSQPHTQTPSTSSTVSAPTKSTATSSAPVDPAARPAVDAYLKFTEAVNNAERKPHQLGQAVDPVADYGKYSFDPVRSQENAYFLYLVQQGWVRRGTPPVPRPLVVSTDLAAKPYPTVVLTNCSSPSPGWERNYYNAKTGQAVPDPYATRTPLTTSVQVIYYEDHWGVYKIDHLTDRPCVS